MIIRQVPFASPFYRQSLKLREEILRKPIGMVLRDKDVASDDAEFHIVALDGEEMIGCVLLRPLSADHIKLRQMAVADGQQGKGVGAALVKFAENFAKDKGYKTIECNARKTAEGFYAKLGYAVQSEPFIEVKVLTLKMGKVL